MELFSIALVLIGSAFMSNSIMLARKMRLNVPPGLQKKWFVIMCLMIFFLAGYIGFILIIVNKSVFPMELVVGSVFLGGALFVFTVINLSKTTINELRTKELDITRINEQLEARILKRTSELDDLNKRLLTELSERKEAETKIRESRRALEEAYAELKATQSHLLQREKMASIGQLAAGVAHEINNPIGFIMSNLGTLQKYAGRLSDFIKGVEGLSMDCPDGLRDSMGESKQAMKIDYILGDLEGLVRESLDGAERVKKIVQNLKGFARLDESERSMADINAGIERTINIVWNELKYKAELKREYGDIPLTLCNAGELNQVFMNMLLNAADAIESRGEIGIRTWDDKDNIYVSISDTGSGIPEDKMGRVFEPFFTTKEVGKGTGLGLSIAYDIVKKHNGNITVESKEGKGTTFTISMPVVLK